MGVNIGDGKRKLQVIENLLGAILDCILLNIDREPDFIAYIVLATVQINYRRCDDSHHIVEYISREVDCAAFVNDCAVYPSGSCNIGKIQPVYIIILRHLIGAELVLILLLSFGEQKVLEIAVAVNPTKVMTSGLVADLEIDEGDILSSLKKV